MNACKPTIPLGGFTGFIHILLRFRVLFPRVMDEVLAAQRGRSRRTVCGP